MKKETPFLDFYYKCMKSGVLRNNGLCNSLPSKSINGDLIEDLFSPVDYQYEPYFNYWAYDGYPNPYERVNHDILKVKYDFTPMRQNIVLLCAAINGEL